MKQQRRSQAGAKSISPSFRRGVSMDVRMPDGTLVRNVPEGTTQADLMARYERFNAPEQSAAPAPEQSWFKKTFIGNRPAGEELARQGGLAARHVTQAAAALPLIAAEGGAGVGNLINRAMGRDGNYSPQRDFQSLLDRWLPKPETTTEKAVELGSTMLAGGRMPGNVAPSPKVATPADAVIREGVKRHVPVYYDDVGGAISKKVGTAAESLGFLGTGSGRAIQSQATKKAAGEFADEFATSAGDDVPVLIQKGMQRRLAGLKRGANNLYTRVDKLLAPSGNVDATAFRAGVAKRIQEEQAKGSVANADTIKTLQKYLDAPDGDFAFWRSLRSSLGDDISGYYTGKGAAVGSKGVDALQEAKLALDSAMAAHAKKAGGAGFNAWRQADGYYKANVVPFKEAGFKDLVKTAEPEKAWRYLLANNTESRAVRMFNGLDRNGRNAVKYGLVKEAMETATDGKGNFSPAKFAKYLEDHDAAVGTFFKGAERKDLDGFRNLMRHVERAGQYAENPPTGNRVVPWLIGGAAIYSGTAAKVGMAGLTIRALFQTKTGRDLLLSAARYKPGTPEMERVLTQISRYAASAQVAGQSSDTVQ
jgi:hypothetical protein